MRARLGSVRCEAAVARGQAGEHGAQVVCVDDSFEVEPSCTAPDPLAGDLASARVVGVERLRHTRQLIRLLANSKSAHRQHIEELDSEYTLW